MAGGHRHWSMGMRTCLGGVFCWTQKLRLGPVDLFVTFVDSKNVGFDKHQTSVRDTSAARRGEWGGIDMFFVISILNLLGSMGP